MRRSAPSAPTARLSWAQVAEAAHTPPMLPKGMTAGLSATRTFNADHGPTFPNGCHVCEVEIDGETGALEIVNYVVVDDVGTVLNPMIVEGQIHGGIVQGLSQVMAERMVHDADTGQPLTGSFMDYAMPRAVDVPFFVNESNPHPTPHNPLGAKGAGEGGGRSGRCPPRFWRCRTRWPRWGSTGSTCRPPLAGSGP